MHVVQKLFCCIGIIAMTAWTQQVTEITGWKMQDSSVVGSATGATISASSYNASSWYTATVPGTVLGTLVDQGVYTDPYYGTYMVDNNGIPDLAAAQKRYWFRSTFTVSPASGQRVWLDIEGINYQAYIFVNGDSVGTMLGAFKGAKYDITSNLDPSGTNCLAIKIRGPYTPGSYHTKQSGSCGNNGGLMTGDGPTFIASQGWDWIPTIPDRDMGIWKPVYIRVTGPVVLRTPWIKTTNVSASSATVPLQVTLLNATNTAVSGTANANIDGTTQFAAQTVNVPASGSTTVTFAPLTMNTPNLWWPNGYGIPNLYTCTISFTPTGGSVSDTSSFKFGVREWSFSTSGASLIVSCNGQRILCRGGNWGMDDAMKRWDLHKLENKVRYHKEMNFNIIRDWIGMTDNEPFYQFCDKYGMIVWEDFWQPYGPGLADGPDPSDLTLFENNELDKILRTRNHACIAIWCARNETAPNATLLAYLQGIYPTYDGTRYVQPSSGSNGVHSGGPYTYTSPTSALSVLSGFHTELGGPTPPSYETFNAFLPAGSQMPMGNNAWSFHDYCSGNGAPMNFTNAMPKIFGSAPSTIQQCCSWSQLMNYDDYRAYFETLQSKRFNGATGLLLWMSNCVWPSTMWQTYDYYMEGTGAMYGCQHGAEPIHIMYFGSTQVQVVNNTNQPLSNYTASAATYNLNGLKAWGNSATVNIGADTTSNVFAITTGASTPYFLDLKLKDASGNLVSKNFYWLPSDGVTNIGGMLTMDKATLVATANADWSKTGGENTITFKVVDTSAVCAVACRLQVITRNANIRVLPVHYNDNYFSLAPGDTQFVSVKFDDADTKGDYPVLSITGVNVDYTIIDVNPAGVRRGSGSIAGKSGMFGRWAGRNLKIFNIPTGKAWHVTMVTISGRTVLNVDGIGTNGEIIVNAAGLRPGAYIATIKSDVETYSAKIMVADHAKLR